MALSRATDSALDKQRNMEIIHQHLEPDALAERLAVGAGLSLDEVCEFALPKN
jgi:hypothetical protein